MNTNDDPSMNAGARSNAPILTELWALKREMNAEANYDIACLVANAAALWQSDPAKRLQEYQRA